MKRTLLSILAFGILLLSACGAPTTAPPATIYTLSVSVSPSGVGSVSPSGGQYEEGTLVTLTATPAGGYTFDYWDGDASGSLATTTITIDSDKSITAHFVSTTSPPSTITQKDVDDAKQVVLQYWDAFNSYDAERAFTLLEESYRQEREESLRSELDRMKTFNVRLGVAEEAEPVVTSEGTIEIRMKLTTPIGAKHVTYYLVKVNGEWKISRSVEE